LTLLLEQLQLTLEPAVLFLQLALMASPRKGLLRLLAQLVAPAIQHPLGHPQVAGDLGHGLLTRLTQAHRFQLELARIEAGFRVLVGVLCHTSCPLSVRGVYLLTLR